MNPVRILIADDHEFVRLGLRRVLTENHRNDWQIVAEASNGLDAIEMGESLRPDVAILDLSMPGRSGLEVTERLVKCVPRIRILIFTMYVSAPILQRVRNAGASAYVAKNESPRMLVFAVERLLAGKRFFPIAMNCRPALETAHAEYLPSQCLLTPRELSVFRLLASGRSNKELAGDLNISVRTAEAHHANVLVKLNCESLGELVRIAVRDGVI